MMSTVHSDIHGSVLNSHSHNSLTGITILEKKAKKQEIGHYVLLVKFNKVRDLFCHGISKEFDHVTKRKKKESDIPIAIFGANKKI